MANIPRRSTLSLFAIVGGVNYYFTKVITAPLNKATVKLSFKGKGNNSITAAAKAPQKINFIFINNSVGKRIIPIKRQVRKKTRLPSKLLPQILVFPYLWPTRVAAASPKMRKRRAVMAMLFSKRRIVKKTARRNQDVPENFLASYSRPTGAKILQITRLTEGIRNLEASQASAIPTKIETKIKVSFLVWK
jgi:hypothetical protein